MHGFSFPCLSSRVRDSVRVRVIGVRVRVRVRVRVTSDRKDETRTKKPIRQRGRCLSPCCSFLGVSFLHFVPLSNPNPYPYPSPNPFLGLVGLIVPNFGVHNPNPNPNPN
jgi:hypothetical protein